MPNGVWSSLIQDYAAYVTAASASLGAIIYIYKKGIKPMLQAVKSYYETVEKIDKIFEELTPNGGTSIKDKIDKIDAGLNLVSERQRAREIDDPVARFETDPVGNCTWINRTYSSLVQRTPSELMGHGWQNAISQLDREHVVTDWYKSVEEKREFTMDFNFETPNGALIECKVRSYKMTDPGGNIIGYYGTIIEN
jgi:PAS domain S-box-containing protein